MNSTTQSLIERNIDRIDADLTGFLYDVSLSLMYSDFEDLYMTLYAAGLEVDAAMENVLHKHIEHATYWFYTNKLPDQSLISWIKATFHIRLPFSAYEIEDYIIQHAQDWKEYVNIDPRKRTIEGVW